MNAQENTPEGDLLDILVTLLETYERKAYPMSLPDPVEAIKFYMEQNEMTPKDLEPVIGRMNRVCEVLNHTRPLTPCPMKRASRHKARAVLSCGPGCRPSCRRD